MFAKWGSIVDRCTIMVFIVSLLAFAYAITGLRHAADYDGFLDQPFTPQGSPSILNIFKMLEQFGLLSIERHFEIIVIAKEDDDDDFAVSGNIGNLLTLDAFGEMLELHELIYSDIFAERDELATDDGTVILKGGIDVYYEDICKTITPLKDNLNFKENRADKNCVTSPKPIDFVYSGETNTYDLSQFGSDEELVARIQAGYSDKFIFQFRDSDFIDVSKMFQGTEPEIIRFDKTTGENNIMSAATARFFYYQTQGQPLPLPFWRLWDA